MESIKMNEKIFILIGYESGFLELLEYQQNGKISLLGTYLQENQHELARIVLDFKKFTLYAITVESEIFQLKI